MKQLPFIFASVILVLVLVVFSKPELVAGGAPEFAGGANLYSYTSRDTITNAELDTINIPATFASRFTQSHSIDISSLSGTAAITVVLEETNLLSGDTSWHQVDSVILNAATRSRRITADEVYGVGQRIRVKGAGTQSTKYGIQSAYKRK